jgi:hypothetical protein
VSAWLAPNYGHSVFFVDLHAPRDVASAIFLADLEQWAIVHCKARVHWGKEFFSSHEVIRQTFPASHFEVFERAKMMFDPLGLFSTAYTKRVLGI